MRMRIGVSVGTDDSTEIVFGPGGTWEAVGTIDSSREGDLWNLTGQGHIRWVQEQVRQRKNSGCEGLDELEAAQAHRLAGDRDEQDGI